MGLFDFLNKKPSQNSEVKIEKNIGLSPGDIFYTETNGRFSIFKLLAHEPENQCYHVLIYHTMDTMPIVDQIDQLPIQIYHAPINSNGFTKPTFMASRPLSANDLSGYHFYLRQTSPSDHYIPIAIQYYKNGCALSDEQRHTEAIDEYSKAIDLFEPFFEALDNRAFSKMDLGLWSDAIEDFQLLLRHNPNSLLATVNIGKCYIHLSDLMNAKKYYELAHTIDPNHEATTQTLQRINEHYNQ